MKRRELTVLLLTMTLTTNLGITDVFHASSITSDQETQINTEIETENDIESETGIEWLDTQVYTEEEDDEDIEMRFFPEISTFEFKTMTSGSEAFNIKNLNSSKVVTAEHKLVAKLTTQNVLGYNCTATAAMTVVGNDLYCIRTVPKQEGVSKKYPVVLHIIKNFATNPVESTVVIETAGGSQYIAAHANSLSHSEDNGKITFYMATGNLPDTSEFTDEAIKGNQIVCFGTDGKIFKKYSYTEKVHSVNYAGKDTDGKKLFLINRGTKSGGYYFYILAKENGNKVERIKNYHFNVLDENINGVDNYIYNTGNDAYYDEATKQMYFTMFLKESDGTIKKNGILQYDMSKDASTYNPVRVIKVDATTESKFEIEGMRIFGSKKYICTNTDAVNGKPDADAIYVIYKK